MSANILIVEDEPAIRQMLGFTLAGDGYQLIEAGDVEGMTPKDIKTYIRYIADWRLRQLNLPTVYGVTENPLPWLQVLLSGVEHANFFEARSTEYSKAATKGQWHGAEGVWGEFDKLLAKRTENVLPAE